MAASEGPVRIGAFDGDLSKLEEAIARSTKIHAVIAHNIANAATPGFEALEFDKVLGKAVKRIGRPQVNLEEEMAALGENSLRYSAYAKLLSSRLNILRTIATQGRR